MTENQRLMPRFKFPIALSLLVLIAQLEGYGQQRSTNPKHSGAITSIAFNAYGNTVATGSQDSTVKLWDVMTGRELRTLAGHKEGVTTIAFSPDGKTLATGSFDKTVRLWSAETGQLLDILDTTYKSRPNVALSIVFNPNGKTLACGYDGGLIRVYDVMTRREVVALTGHDYFACTSLVFGARGDFLISGGLDGRIKIWDPNAGRELRTIATIHSSGVFPNSPEPVRYLALGNDTVLVSSDSGFQIRRWNLMTGQQLFVVEPRSGRATAYSRPIDLTSDSRVLASGGADGLVTLWNVSDGRELKQFSIGKDRVSSLAFSPNGNTLATGAGDGDLRLWTIEPIRALWPSSETASVDSKSVTSLPPGVILKSTVKAPSVVSLALSSDGRTIAWGDLDGRVRILSSQTSATLRTLTGLIGSVPALAFSSDSRTLASGEDGNATSAGANGADGTLKLWSAQTGALLRTFRGLEGTVESVAFSPDGTILASVDSASENQIKLWNPRTGALLRKLNSSSPGPLAFSRDGKLIASSNGSGEVTVWDARTGLIVIKLREQWGRQVAFSPNGKLLATSGGGDSDDKHFVKLWDVQTGRLIRTLVESEGTKWMAFSADSGRLATCSRDGVALWGVETGEGMWKLNGETKCDIVIFFQDDRSLITSSFFDGLIKTWDLSPLR